MPSIILASASPRRKELLQQSGMEFKVVPSSIEEIPFHDELPKDYALRVAADKALFVARDLDEDCIVIGADTIVVIGNEILGKPDNEEEAKAMLRKISGKEHRVITAFAIVRPRAEVLHTEAVETRVKVKSLEPWEIEGYIKTEEPMDKAGAYGAQGVGAFMIEEIHGSYTNVVGLPVCQLVSALSRLGILELWK